MVYLNLLISRGWDIKNIQWKSFEDGNDVMIEFDYDLDYKNLDFKPNDTRYRIGRGEQGVLLVRPYTDDICIYWKFRT